MRRALIRHPDTPCGAVDSITVDLAAGAGGVVALHYRLVGRIGAVKLTPLEPRRTDGLWKHTCFEAFFRAPGAAAYREFNFAPSGAWAAYSFEAERAGMAPLDITPMLDFDASASALRLTATLSPGMAAPYAIALAAVIEETSGATSYWALAHPPGKPDFHHSVAFAAALPPETP